MRSGEIALPYRLQVIVELRNMRSLLQLAVNAQSFWRNVSYNAVRLLQELVQILDLKHIGLDWLRIVLDQHLVKEGRNVHYCVQDGSGLGGSNDELPAGMPFRLVAETTSQ